MAWRLTNDRCPLTIPCLWYWNRLDVVLSCYIHKIVGWRGIEQIACFKVVVSYLNIDQKNKSRDERQLQNIWERSKLNLTQSANMTCTRERCSCWQSYNQKLFILPPVLSVLKKDEGRVFPHSSVGKSSVCNAGDLGSIPRLGISPGEGNGNPLQYSCLENSMDRGAWQSKGLQESAWLAAKLLPWREITHFGY